MDAYRPIYDAVISKLYNCDVGAAVEGVMREAGIDHSIAMITEKFRYAIGQYIRPSVLFRPKICQDGNAFIALLGDDLQSGVAGCGEAPTEAMADFDVTFSKKATFIKANANQGGE